MTLRAALRATLALVAISLASVLPAAAQMVTPPGGAVFGIGAGATATSASVVMTMPNGTKIPIGVLNPTTGVFSPSGLGAETTRATAAEGTNAAAITSETTRAQGVEATKTTAAQAAAAAPVQTVAGRVGAVTLSNSDISGLGAAATLPVGPGGVASYTDSRIVGAYALTSNRPTITPSVTSVGTTVATVFPASSYVSVRIRMTGSGQQMACTGDGTAPALGTSTTALAPGQDILWPVQTGGAMPSGPFQCVASGTITIAGEAH